MAGSVNKAIIVGNLGKDPEIRTFANGGKVCNLTVATSENWKDKQSGEKKERTEWHRIAVFQEGLVGICERYLRKGAKVYIEGQLETRKWTDQQGVEKYSTEIALRPFNGTLTMLGDAKGGDNSESSGGTYDQSSQGGGGGYGGSGGGLSNDLDDVIPFNMEWR